MIYVLRQLTGSALIGCVFAGLLFGTETAHFIGAILGAWICGICLVFETEAKHGT